jgi:hypothetical protein
MHNILRELIANDQEEEKVAFPSKQAWTVHAEITMSCNVHFWLI